MKFSSIYLYALFTLLLVNTAMASPPQRLIIQFDSSLNSDQKQKLNEQLKLIIEVDFTLLPHSTEQRWIIVVNPPLDKVNLKKISQKITGLEHVEYAEPDQLMTMPR